MERSSDKAELTNTKAKLNKKGPLDAFFTRSKSMPVASVEPKQINQTNSSSLPAAVTAGNSQTFPVVANQQRKVANEKKASNPFSTGGGGVVFEQQVQAYFVALYLSDGVFPICQRTDCYKIAFQGRRFGVQTDDLILYFKNEAQQESKLLIQVKHKLTFSKKNETKKAKEKAFDKPKKQDATKEALTQAWTDFKQQDSSKYNPKVDSIVLVTGSLSQPVIDHVIPIFNWARVSENEQDFMNRFENNAKEKKEKLLHMREIIEEFIGDKISDFELWEFMKCLHLLGYDFDNAQGKDLSGILSLLKGRLLDSTNDNVQDVWNHLCREVARFNPSAGIINKETLDPNLIKKFKKKEITCSSWGIPCFDTDFFVGNQAFLDEIIQMFLENKGKSTLVPVVGLGGLGKTSVALKVVSKISEHYDYVLWFNAKDESSLEQQFIEFGIMHGINLDGSPSLNVKIEKIKNWLIKKQNILMIFDDAVSFAKIKSYIPSLVGHVLVTSINSVDWRNGKLLKPMSSEDGIKLFRKETEITDDINTDENIIGLTEGLLGNLPLAIAQAGAYIKATNTPLLDYISYYKQQKKQMLENEMLQQKSPEHISVYLTFTISMNALGQNPAKTLLSFCANLNPNNIPKSMLAQATIASPLSIATLNQQIMDLQRYSLVKSDAVFVGIHCVVQDVLREKLKSEDTMAIWLEKTFDLLNRCFSYRKHDLSALEAAKQLIPHMIYVKEVMLTCSIGIKDVSRGKLLYNLGVFYLDYLYDSIAAEEYFKGAEPFLKSSSLLKANSKFLLKAYYKNKKYEDAASYAAQFKLDEEEDIDFICVVGNFYLRDDSKPDNFKLANACFAKALKLSEEIQSKEKIAMVYHYFGTAARMEAEKNRNRMNSFERNKKSNRWSQGIKDEAEKLFEESVKHYQKALLLKKEFYKPSHPEIVRTIHQLGNVFILIKEFKKACGNLKEAFDLLNTYYEGRLNAEMVEVLRSLGIAHGELGEWDTADQHLNKAEVILKQLVSDGLEVKLKNKLELKVTKTKQDLNLKKQSSVARFFRGNSSGSLAESKSSSGSTLASQSSLDVSILNENLVLEPESKKVKVSIQQAEQHELEKSSSLDMAFEVTPEESLFNTEGKRPTSDNPSSTPQFSNFKKSKSGDNETVTLKINSDTSNSASSPSI